MHTRLVLLCWLVLLVGSPARAIGGPKPLAAPVERVLRLTARPTGLPAFVNYGPSRQLVAGEQAIAGTPVRFEREGRHPVLCWRRDDQPRKQRLTRRKGYHLDLLAGGERSLAVFPDRLGSWHHAGGESLRFRCRKVDLELVDQDHDGKWFEVGEDMWRRVGDPHLLPLRKVNVVDAWTFEVLSYDADKQEVHVRVQPLDPDLNDDERAALRTLNRERTRMGLLGAVALPDFSEKLRLHAEWMAFHDKIQHSEIPGSEKYSHEGNEAGESSVILAHERSTEIATYVDIDAPIHGHVLCMPEFVRTGAGVARGTGDRVYGGLWTMEKSGFKHAVLDDARFPATWPPHMAVDVPRSWTHEGEDPRPKRDQGREQGYPIKVYLSPGVIETAVIAELQVELRACGSKTPLECFIVAPDRPLGHPGTPYLQYLLGQLRPIFVLPRRVLEADTWYCLSLSWVEEGRKRSHQAAFCTGRQRGQYRDLSVGASR